MLTLYIHAVMREKIRILKYTESELEKLFIRILLGVPAK